MEKLIENTIKHLKIIGTEEKKVPAPLSGQKPERTKSEKKVSANLAQIVATFRKWEEEEGMEPYKEQVKAKPGQKEVKQKTPAEKAKSLERLDPLLRPLTHGDLPLLLFTRIPLLPLDDNTNISRIFAFVFRHRQNEAADYVLQHPQILHQLVQGYRDNEIALTCGNILREMLRDEKLTTTILNTRELLDPFFEIVCLPKFDVATHAFETFKKLLTKHPTTIGKWLNQNKDMFLQRYNTLIESGGYVAKRQAIKILGEILTTRSNFHFMMAYINDPVQLELIISCFAGHISDKATKFEAFHIFKIFVANPKKSEPVLAILIREKKRLIDFLTQFDWLKFKEQFSEEKAMILSALAALPDAAPAPAAAEPSSSSSSAPPS